MERFLRTKRQTLSDCVSFLIKLNIVLLDSPTAATLSIKCDDATKMTAKPKMFSHFVRLNYHILIFEICIGSTLNRQKYRLQDPIFNHLAENTVFYLRRWLRYHDCVALAGSKMMCANKSPPPSHRTFQKFLFFFLIRV